MGTSVQLTPLAGAHSEGPLCYLLQVDDFRFLLDCGWNDGFDVSLLQPLVSVAPTVDAVLLSHSDTHHLGAIPYAVGKLGLNAPIYCTNPVKSMGHLQMYDHCISRRAVSNFDLFTLDDVDNAFKLTCTLKYSQNLQLTGKGQGITISPLAAGRLLGGTMWKITKDTEDIIYAVDFNHRKERHLNATVLESFTRPAVLITDSYNALNSQPSRRHRDQDFIDSITRTLRCDGNVLLPVETAGRVLELILFLDQHWSSSRLTYPIVLLTHVSSSTVDFAKCSLEWMSDLVTKSFEQTRENVFSLKCVQICTSRDKLPSGPKVVFASMASLETGFARDLFIEWSPDPRSLVLFTERAQSGTLARQLQVEPPPKFVKVTVSKKVALVGEELEAYEEEQLRVKEAAKAEESKSNPDAEMVEAEPAAEQTPSVEGSKASKAASGVTSHQNIFVDGFTATTGTAVPLFPYYENICEKDEYGEVINPDDFVIKEEYMDYSITQATATNPDGGMEDDSLIEKPSKVLTNDIMLPVNCKLTYMDYEGRADGRSIKSIMSHVAPLKLVLIHGAAESTEHLRQHCLKTGCAFVYTPRVGENVNVTSDLNAFKVRLTENLMSTVLFKKLGEYEVAWIDGEVGPEEDDLLPLLPLSVAAPPPHKTVYVGDLRLADFRQRLAMKGVPAEFAGGVLRCGDNIVVRKSGAQQLVIEGPLSEEYYRVRELLYSQYHTL